MRVFESEGRKNMNPNQPIRDARTLGLPKMLILGLQHMFAMFGATILVPILVRQYGLPLSIQTTLFFAGIGTLFFHVCSKFQVPAFLGSSFAFLGGFATMANLDSGMYAAMDPQDKLSYACGGIVVAGLLYLILARGQQLEALFTAEGARVRPMHTMMGPVTTGGRKRMTFFTPASLMTRARLRYSRPATTMPPQA